MLRDKPVWTPVGAPSAAKAAAPSLVSQALTCEHGESLNVMQWMVLSILWSSKNCFLACTPPFQHVNVYLQHFAQRESIGSGNRGSS